MIHISPLNPEESIPKAGDSGFRACTIEDTAHRYKG
jgi:hypothetical protein